MIGFSIELNNSTVSSIIKIVGYEDVNNSYENDEILTFMFNKLSYQSSFILLEYKCV